MSKEDVYNDFYDKHSNKSKCPSNWHREHKKNYKSIVKPTIENLNVTHGSDEFLSADSDWDSHFPALTIKNHNTFTLTPGKNCDKKEYQGGILKSAGDTYIKVYIFLICWLFTL